MIRIALGVTVFSAFVAAMFGLALLPDLVDSYHGMNGGEQVAVVE